MISIVRGNDFRLSIPVMLVESGMSVPFDFTGAEVAVNIKSCYRSASYPYTIDGSTVIVSVDGSKIVNGTYSVELVIKKDGNMRSYVAKGFRIVESDAERIPVEVGIKTYELETRVLTDYGTRDYEALGNKPQINGVQLSGNLSLAELGVRDYDDMEVRSGIKANSQGIASNAQGITREAERATQAEELLRKIIADKADKVTGKGLSSNDYTNTEKQKLAGLANYDDAQVLASVESVQTQINTLLSGDASIAIESFNEIIAFLSNIEDSQTLDAIIAGVNKSIADVAKRIPTKLSELDNDSWFLTEHQSLAGYAKTTEIPKKLSELANDSGYADKSYVDGIVGDISTVLDEINGEVV